MNLGATELVIIVVIIVLLFGARFLPRLARSAGESQNEFKAGLARSDESAAERARLEAEERDPGHDRP